jgi:hypothetical protein
MFSFAKNENEDLIMHTLDVLIDHSSLLKELGGLVD